MRSTACFKVLNTRAGTTGGGGVVQGAIGGSQLELGRSQFKALRQGHFEVKQANPAQITSTSTQED